jgi:hypothetical protein
VLEALDGGDLVSGASELWLRPGAWRRGGSCVSVWPLCCCQFSMLTTAPAFERGERGFHHINGNRVIWA